MGRMPFQNVAVFNGRTYRFSSRTPRPWFALFRYILVDSYWFLTFRTKDEAANKVRQLSQYPHAFVVEGRSHMRGFAHHPMFRNLRECPVCGGVYAKLGVHMQRHRRSE